MEKLILAECENALIAAAQFIDATKMLGGGKGAWTDDDQAMRDGIAHALRAIRDWPSETK